MPPATRSSNGKRQTRLAFTPLPTSSPQTAQYPVQIKERAAAVRYDDYASPSKKRRLSGLVDDRRPSSPANPGKHANSDHSFSDSSTTVVGSSPSRKLNQISLSSGQLLLTPLPSSQTQSSRSKPNVTDDQDLSSSDSVILPRSKHKVSVKTFTRTPYPISSPFKPPPIAPTSNPNASKTVKKSWGQNNSNGGAYDQKAAKNGRSGQDQEEVDHSSSSEDIPLPSGRKLKRDPKVVDGSSEESSDETDELLASPRRTGRILRSNAKTPQMREAGKPTEIERPGTQRLTRRQAKLETTSSPNLQHRASGLAARQIAIKNLYDDFINLDSDSDSGTPLTPLIPRTPKKNIQKSASPTYDSDSSMILPSNNRRREDRAKHDAQLSSDSDVIIVSHEKRKENVEDSSDSDVVLLSPKKRKQSAQLTRGVEPESAAGSHKEIDAEIEEDIADLQDTEVRTERTRGRVVDSKKDKARQQLELLKQRRASQKPTPSSDALEQPQIHGLYDDDSISEPGSAAESEVSDGEEQSRNDAVRQALQADSDAYDEDFVTDEEGGLLGAPEGLDEIPLEFTRHAHKKPKEHFKDAVEWMVHNKLNPAFPRDDPVYQIAFNKLDDEVRGYAGSKFLSAAWTGDFAKALKARPGISASSMPALSHHKCDACNRSGHPATFQISFSGKPYHRHTLEAVSDDEDEDEDAKSRDENGNPLPGIEREYFVGRVCAANAEIAHSLLHWRFALNEWVLDWLQTQGYTSVEEIVEREGWSIKKRREYANEVVDEMEANGHIRDLYRDFKINLDHARNAKPARWSRG